MGVDIYKLTSRGEALAHNIYAPNNEKWRVIFYLSKVGEASKDKILAHEPNATGHTLYTLRRKGAVELVGKMAEV